MMSADARGVALTPLHPSRLAGVGALAGLALLGLMLVASAEHTVFGAPGLYDVSADRSEIGSKADRVVLVGKVEVTQNERRFRSPRVVITYGTHANGGKAASPARSIRHLEADGPAYFVTPDRSIRADHASYDSTSGDIVLTGGVIVTQGQNVSTGDRLVINEAAGTSFMTAAPGKRVRSVIYSQ